MNSQLATMVIQMTVSEKTKASKDIISAPSALDGGPPFATGSSPGRTYP
jgi:hypothetical protein